MILAKNELTFLETTKIWCNIQVIIYPSKSFKRLEKRKAILPNILFLGGRVVTFRHPLHPLSERLWLQKKAKYRKAIL